MSGYLSGRTSLTTVQTADIADNAITLAKMAGGTDGNIISYDTSGDPVAVATGSAGQILTSAGAGAVPSFQDAAGGGITEADMWRITASTSGGSGTFSSNWERADTYSYDKLGTGMTESSGVFTFPSTGHYRVTFIAGFSGANIQYAGLMMMVTVNNSDYNQYAKTYTSLDTSGDETFAYTEAIIDVTNTTNVKVRFDQQMALAGGSWAGDTNLQRTGATFIKLADT